MGKWGEGDWRKTDMFAIGDQVQAPNHRIGTVVATRQAGAQEQRITVRFLDGSVWDGSPDNFQIHPGPQNPSTIESG